MIKTMYSRLCAHASDQDPEILANCQALDRGETLSNEQVKQLLDFAIRTKSRTRPQRAPTRTKAVHGQSQITQAIKRTRPFLGQIDETRPLALAREILLIAQELGYNGVLAYTLGHTPMRPLRALFDPEEETEEMMEGLLTVCLNVAAYNGWILNSDNGDPIVLQPFEIDLETLLELKGLYAADFQGSETHAFTWVIDGDTVTYAGGYGGVCQMVVADFDRLEYMSSFVRAMQGSLNDYLYVFQIPEYPAFEVDFKSLKLWPSLNYL